METTQRTEYPQQLADVTLILQQSGYDLINGREQDVAAKILERLTLTGHRFEVQLAFMTLPSPDAESVTVITVSGVPKWVVEQHKLVQLVVEE